MISCIVAYRSRALSALQQASILKSTVRWGGGAPLWLGKAVRETLLSPNKEQVLQDSGYILLLARVESRTHSGFQSTMPFELVGRLCPQNQVAIIVHGDTLSPVYCIMFQISRESSADSSSTPPLQIALATTVVLTDGCRKFLQHLY